MNKSYNTGQMGGSRNFGLEGAGKGDGDRTADMGSYNENLADISNVGVGHSYGQETVDRKGRRTFRYGVTPDAAPAESDAPEWPDIIGATPDAAPAESATLESVRQQFERCRDPRDKMAVDGDPKWPNDEPTKCDAEADTTLIHRTQIFPPLPNGA